MAATGTPIFDALALTTIEVDLLRKVLTGKAAFVNTQTGETHGWTEGSGTIWSPDTKSALAALVTCMEQDLARLHLGYTAEAQPPKVGLPANIGLLEHLADSDGTSSV